MRVSVVIPTYRRIELLSRCLDALILQDFDPSEYEVIVADDADDEATRRFVASLLPLTPMAIRYVAVKGPHGPAAARNAGWRSARGVIVAFTDDDCVPDFDWLTAGVRAITSDNVTMAVAGRTIVPLPPSPTDYERDVAGLEGAEFVTANCFCRRDALVIVGGFDERFRLAWREDSDLQFSLMSVNAKVIRDDRVRVVHPIRPAPWGISLSQQRKCLFDALLFKKHQRLFRRHIKPSVPWGYYAALFGLLVGLVAAIVSATWVALLGLACWALLTLRFFLRRMHRASRKPSHVAEMLVTSALIPPLSVFWRLYGATKFRVWFV